MYALKDATDLMKRIYSDYQRRHGGSDTISQQEIADAIGLRSIYLNRVFRAIREGRAVRMHEATITKVEKYLNRI